MSNEPVNADKLAAAAREALAVGAGSAYATLVPNGSGNPQAMGLLNGLTAKTVLLRPLKSLDAAACVLSGLWLWHDWLDRSHTISQDVNTVDGSYWHAIMHRREGDFWNSKYWLNKCRGHPALEMTGNRVTDLINSSRGQQSLMDFTLGNFDPQRFVDLVEEIHDQPNDARHRIAVEIQRIEWRCLFEHCLASAAAG